MPDPSDSSERAETKQRVQNALRELPDAEREVVVLRMFDDMSFSNIAEVTDVSVSTAKSRMRYALIRLRPALMRYVGSPAAPD